MKLEAKPDDEESVRIKESAILALGRVFKETKDAKGMKMNDSDRFVALGFLQRWQR